MPTSANFPNPLPFLTLFVLGFFVSSVWLVFDVMDNVDIGKGRGSLEFELSVKGLRVGDELLRSFLERW